MHSLLPRFLLLVGEEGVVVVGVGASPGTSQSPRSAKPTKMRGRRGMEPLSATATTGGAATPGPNAKTTRRARKEVAVVATIATVVEAELQLMKLLLPPLPGANMSSHRPLPTSLQRSLLRQRRRRHLRRNTQTKCCAVSSHPGSSSVL